MIPRANSPARELPSQSNARLSHSKAFESRRRSRPVERRTFIETGAVLAGSLLAGCAGRARRVLGADAPVVDGACDGPGRPWPTAGGDPGRTGSTDTPPPPDDAESVDLLAGVTDDGRQRLAAALPAVVDGTAYVPTGSELAAVDLAAVADGPVWTHDVEDDVDAVPAVACGVVLVPGLNGLTAIDPATGEAVWHAEVGGHTATTLGVAGETVYVAGVNPSAVDIRHGTVEWTAQGGDTLAVGRDGIYTTHNANGTGGISAHDPDGEPRWHLALGKIVGSASVTDGTVYVADTAGTVYAIDAVTGETDWSRSLGGVRKIFSGLAVDGGDVAVPAGVGETSAVLDAVTGEPRWTAETGIVTGRPVIGPDWVAFGRTNTGVTVYDRPSGEERTTWSRENHDLGTIDGIVPIEDGFIVRGGSDSGLTLLR